MSRKRKLSLIFLMYCALNAGFTVATPSRFVDTLPSFTVPESNGIANVAVDHSSGEVFVGGRNVLYHFSADLEIKQKVRTGPLVDAYDCSIPPNSCGVERKPINNYNHLLKLINFLGSPPKLLLCGSVYKKLCQVRSTDNLEEVHWVYPYNNSLGYNLGGQKNRALFDRGRDGQWTLFTSHAANTRDGNEIHVPVVSSKVLVKENDSYYFRYPLKGVSVPSSVFVYGTYRREIIDEGFVHDGYVYFLVKHVWRNNTATRLLRFCTEDATFRSYAELPLECHLKDGVKTSHAIAAHYGDSSASTDKSLYVSYKSVIHPNEGTALCVFPMSTIVKTFVETPRNCNREMFGEMCDKEEKNNNDSFCGSIGSPYLINQPLVSYSSAFLPMTWYPTITIVIHNNKTVLIGGGDDGSVIKVNLSTGEIISNNSMLEKNTTIKRSSWDIFKKPFVFDREGKHIYLLFQNKIIKYPVASCGVHQTCSLCISRENTDPLQCGWCDWQCTTLEECPHSGSFTLENCKRARLYGIRPHKGPTSGGTNVTLFGDNLDYAFDKESVFIVSKRICTITGFNRDQATCTTGNFAFFKKDFPEAITLRSKNVTYTIQGNTPLDFKIKGLSRSFAYTADPVINNINPEFTTISGLMNVTATGLHLDSVQHPKLIVKVSMPLGTNNLELLEDCWSDPKSKGTIMTCRTPPLPKRSRITFPTSSSPLLTHVAFIMDDVQSLRDFNIDKKDMSRLWYYPDPVFEEVTKIGDRTLQIKGNYLQLLSLEDFQIKLGKDYPCNIVEFSVESLTCEIPPTLLTNSTFYEIKFSVEVVIGYSRYQIGYITIGNSENDNFGTSLSENSNSVWWIILVIILVCVISVTFMCFKCWKKKFLHRVGKVKAEVINGDLPMTSGDVVNTTVIVQSHASAVQVESAGNLKALVMDSPIVALLEDKNLIIPKSSLVIGEKVGAGQFGCVFEGVLQRPEDIETENVKVAIKTLREHAWSSPQTVESFLKEALIMKDFDHPNVLSLLGVCFQGSGPSIVLPYMENGDLCSYIKDETKLLQVTQLLKFATDIASGMAYLADKKFLHRDLAARNCILDTSLDVKVADFGLSRDVYVDDYYCCESRNVKLPYRWMALESLERQIYSTKTDVWSYGVLLWELLTRGSIPYANVGNWDVLEYVKLGHRLEQPEHCPKSLYRVMLACWNKESKQRPTFSLLHECISYIRQRIQDRKEKQAPPKSVPAQHTIYHNSSEHYIRMDGEVLNKKILKKSFCLENEYLDMSKKTSV